MKLSRRFAQAFLALSITSLAAGCGGGNDQDAGGLTSFSVVPSSITLTGPNTTTCGGGYAGRVYVYGGSGPYQVDNTGPDIIAVSRTKLDRPGDFFDVQFAGACMTSISVVVTDALGRRAIVSMNSTVAPGS